MDQIRCTQCGSYELDPGFVSDGGQGAFGFARWVAGPLQTGPLGHARLWGRTKLAISAMRCRRCGRLELFAR